MYAAVNVSKNLKNPNVDTDFLPDKQREEQQLLQRRKLQEEWEKQQAQMKGIECQLMAITDNTFGCAVELVEITYSYWDGSGHRREIKVRR